MAICTTRTFVLIFDNISQIVFSLLFPLLGKFQEMSPANWKHLDSRIAWPSTELRIESLQVCRVGVD